MTCAEQTRQDRIETFKALAMILLAAVAWSAASRAADWLMPPPALLVTVHLDAPLIVR